jgi:hypothetical protein
MRVRLLRRVTRVRCVRRARWARRAAPGGATRPSNLPRPGLVWPYRLILACCLVAGCGLEPGCGEPGGLARLSTRTVWRVDGSSLYLAYDGVGVDVTVCTAATVAGARIGVGGSVTLSRTRMTLRAASWFRPSVSLVLVSFDPAPPSAGRPSRRWPDEYGPVDRRCADRGEVAARRHARETNGPVV